MKTTRAIVGAVAAMSLMANAVMAQQAAAGKPGTSSNPVVLKSPDGRLAAAIFASDSGRLSYNLKCGDLTMVMESPLGITVDGSDLGQTVELGKPIYETVNEKYPCQGVKAESINSYKGIKIPVRLTNNSSMWTLEVRAFNDGAAFRYIVPGKGKRHIAGEATAWKLPTNALAWFQTDTDGYEGLFGCHRIGAIENEYIDEENAKQKTQIGFPVTVKFSDGSYGFLSEANVFGYSGMTLLPVAGGTTLQGVFLNDKNGWDMDGDITSPWRVTALTPDLNGLVNSDIINNLCPPPDPSLFPDGIKTKWIKPGRCVWSWWAFDDPGTQWDKQKWFVDMAVKMNCQYYLVDAGWENKKFGWMENGKDSWAKLTELCSYAAEKGVEILVWRSYQDCGQGPGLWDKEKRREFFDNLKKAGCKGSKIDYMTSESHEMLAFYEDCARLSAERQLLINFHGAYKPTGEVRTWPNAITREGIRGLEYNKWASTPPSHYANLPFTRLLVGAGDFTPTIFQTNFLTETTFALQMASAVIFTSPLLCWADKPELYLESPAIDIIRSLPTVWDETRVLKGSEIGKLAVFARRSGSEWYVGIINGETTAKTYTLDLSFLGSDDYKAVYCRDQDGQPDALQVEKNIPVGHSTKVEVKLNAGGGFVARFTK